jgi:hypothetical protein
VSIHDRSISLLDSAVAIRFVGATGMTPMLTDGLSLTPFYDACTGTVGSDDGAVYWPLELVLPPPFKA